MNLQGHSKRQLRNVRLTRKFHFLYFGLWILITLCLLVISNVFLYLFMQERTGDIHTSDVAALQDYLRMRAIFIGVLVTEGLVFAVGIVGLAILTAHRIAGPYIRLKSACREVEGGNLDYVLRFREYDRLDDLEEAFNAMLAAVRSRLGGKRA
jgi:methyl-accepting chemotaxis protein